jgi:hypothetical protein
MLILGQHWEYSMRPSYALSRLMSLMDVNLSARRDR